MDTISRAVETPVGSLVRWDNRFLDLAKEVSTWSKDPSTQVGAVIVDRHNRVLSLGYNGFPRGCSDAVELYDDKPTKYARVVHAEVNAIITAQRDLTDCTIYTYPFPPCSNCAGAIIQAGIRRVVSVTPTKEQIGRWGNSFHHMERLFKESNTTLFYVTWR